MSRPNPRGENSGMRKRKLDASDSELAVLKALWERGPGTVREVLASLSGKQHRWAYTTVLTLLQRLREKGMVTCDTEGVAHIYEAALTREGMVHDRLAELADRLCDGETSSLVHALVGRHQFSRKEIAGFRTLLEQLDKKKPSPSKKRKRRSGE